MGHHRNVANPTKLRTAGSKRALEDPTPEDSKAQNSRAVKRQHRDNAGNDGPGSPDHSILAAILLLPHPSDPPATLETKLTKIPSKLASGQSIAAMTGFFAIPNPNRDPVAKAIKEIYSNKLAL